MTHEMNELKAHIRDVPDFPKPGILFRDITPLLLDGRAFRRVIEALQQRYRNRNVAKVVAIESRGFVFAAPLAYAIGAGFVPLRKAGKLPYETIAEAYLLEYGEAAIEIHSDAIAEGERVLVFDDLLATGGTAAASIALVKKLGGNVIEASFVIELAPLRGRDKLNGTPVFSLVQYE
jgi:adenine phosphoribosyltransferase